jgi:hypothetical protein
MSSWQAALIFSNFVQQNINNLSNELGNTLNDITEFFEGWGK